MLPAREFERDLTDFVRETCTLLTAARMCHLKHPHSQNPRNQRKNIDFDLKVDFRGVMLSFVAVRSRGHAAAS